MERRAFREKGCLNTFNDLKEDTFHIGIIGLGPKGLFGFERLLAQLHASKCTNVEVHLFNLTDLFATGWIYDPKQPDYLKMNYPNKWISLNPPKEPSAIIKILSFSEWQANRHNTLVEQEDYQIASRADVGVYLRHYFNELCASADKNIKIHKHHAKVTSIDKMDRGYSIQSDNKQFKSPIFSSLLVTTGHSPSIASKNDEFYKKTNEIPFIYPVNEKLSTISSNTTIACKGIGLTAIDAVLALTEGRGGEFKWNNKEECSYKKSDNELFKIYPFSLSGVPIVPRNPRPIGPQQSFFFKRYIEAFDSHSKLFDFEKDLLPIIKQDIIGEYYFQLFKNHDIYIDLSKPYANVKDEIQKFHHQHPLETMFKPSDLLHPIFDADTLHLEIPKYWRMWVDALKSKSSPLVAAAGTWQNLSEDFNTLYSGNRLTTASKATFIKTYFSLFNRISYGPPVINIKKMLAITEQGILDFSYAKSPSIDTSNGKSNLILNQKNASFDLLIDARIPRGYSKSSKVLFNDEKSKAIFNYSTSKVKLNHANTLMCNEHGNPLDANGNADKNISLYGTPTEGFLFDNDTLSRKRNDTASLWAKHVVEIIMKQKLV